MVSEEIHVSGGVFIAKIAGEGAWSAGHDWAGTASITGKIRAR